MLSSTLPRKRKGTRLERALAKDLAKLCGEAFRVKGSGALPGLPGDVLARITDRRWEGEAKRRARLPQVPERWLGGSDILFIEDDAGKRMVIMLWEPFAELVRAAQPAVTSDSPGVFAMPDSVSRWKKRRFGQ